MKKRLLSALLCLVMAATLLPTAAMAAGRFTDVTERNWFYADVEYAVAQGLVDGTTPTTYSPNSNLTYGSAIKLAACMHKKVTQGNTDFTVGSPWYQVYVDYALANGILPAGRTYDWNANATRAGYMEIFANAIPDTGLRNGYTELAAMNKVDDGAIPDVPMTHPQAAAIYKLYRAGILQGSDAVTHQCNPNNYIQRSEVATILTRMMDANARIAFEMTSGETTSSGGLTITQQPVDAAFVPNGKAEFAVTISGGKGPYTYQWFESYDKGSSWVSIVNDSQYSGVSTAKLTIKLNVTDATSGSLYRCTITDAARATVTTNSVSVVSSGLPLTFVDQPKDVTAEVGSEVFFDATAVGGKLPYTYQWQRKASDGDWQDFPMRNSGYETSRTNQLVLTLYEVDFNAEYSYRCKITDSNGTTITSTAAGITRKQAPIAPLTVTVQPQDVTCKVDEWVNFGVTVSGGKAPLTYQWQMMSDTEEWYDLGDNYCFTGTHSDELEAKIIEQDFAFHSQYRCRITDANGTVVYSDAAQAIQKTDGIPVRPGNSTITRPDSSTSTGSGSTSGTGSTVTRPETSASTSSGSTSGTGSTVTRPETTASGGLSIKTQPKSASAAIGERVTFAVEVTGGQSPYSYQWQYSTDGGKTWMPVANSTKYGGVQTAKFTVKIESSDTATQSLIYRCRISDAAHKEVYSDNVIATYKRPTVAV